LAFYFSTSIIYFTKINKFIFPVIIESDKQAGNVSVDVSHLPAGVYYVRLIGSNGACSIFEIFERVLN